MRGLSKRTQSNHVRKQRPFPGVVRKRCNNRRQVQRQTTLLALEMGKGATSHRMQVASRSWACTHCIFKMDSRQGHAVWHVKLCSVLCGSLDGRGVWGRTDTLVCMASPFTWQYHSILNWFFPETK